MSEQEWQFDGLVGPTHHYAGLATGNLASAHNAGAVSQPRAAALQGLAKMRFVRDLGVRQAVLPPHHRPAVGALRALGFSGSRIEVLRAAKAQAPELFSAAFSSSFMWAANAATVIPSGDAGDGKLHLIPANLVSHVHRAMESSFHYRNLSLIFRNQKLFTVHNALLPCDYLSDEAAANHMIINNNDSEVSDHFFVYGRSCEKTSRETRFVPRQTRSASEAVARLGKVGTSRCHFFRQSPEAIDAGVFHNDVIALSAGNRMVIHAQALMGEHQQQLRQWFEQRPSLRYREVTPEELSLADAVSTYLFNSQLLKIDGENYALVAPEESRNHAGAARLVEQLLAEGMIQSAHYLDVRESMRNGGGPACLRLRVPMTEAEAAAIHPGVVLSDALYAQLCAWVMRYYPETLTWDALLDEAWLAQLDAAYLALESILDLPGLYSLS